MWLVRSIVLFAGIVVLIAFAISNVDQRVTLQFFGRTYPPQSLNLVLLVAALFGAAVCFAVMVWREFTLRTALRNLRRESRRLDDELVALRNLPLAGLQSDPTAKRQAREP